MGRGGVAGGLVGFVGVRMDTVGCHNLYVSCAARSHLFGSIQMADSICRACMGLRHRMAACPDPRGKGLDLELRVSHRSTLLQCLWLFDLPYCTESHTATSRFARRMPDCPIPSTSPGLLA